MERVKLVKMKPPSVLIYWRLILCIARFKALRPKQRVIQFENMSTPQKLYTITCATRQRLIEQILDRGIMPIKREYYEMLSTAQISNASLGVRYRAQLIGERFPKVWHSIHIRFVDPLQDAMDTMGIY